ncbi:ATP-binding protein [Streptomyces sp. NPDC005574]|uniref:ATP-binding protein n=1 Tax=Streptomyces sp. NPDC005574 TaxID=3156891 RepID=UPI00339E2F8C
MYATAYDRRLTGQSGGSTTVPQSVPAAGMGDQVARIPAPRRPAGDHGRDVTRALEHRPEAASTARHLAQAVLEQWHTGAEATDAVVLVVSELVTNAVEHAQGPLALHLHREAVGSRVWVGVSDGGPAEQEGPWTASCTEDEHGRGLTIVDMLADAHGTHCHPHGGTTHWARLTAA